MSRVLTNNTGLRVAIEASIGVLPGTPDWLVAEFDNLTAYGALITTTTRRPISQDRGRKKGTVTDLDSTVDYESDITIDAMVMFSEGFMFAEYANVEFNLRSGTATLPPPAVAAGQVFTIDAASVLLAGKVQFTVATNSSLFFSKGYFNAVNNGLHALTADLASTDTSLAVDSVLVDETPPTNATVEVCGRRTSDLTLTITGSTATLASAALVDWTTTGIQLGQNIHIGSPDPAGLVQNAYDDVGTDDVFGNARVTGFSGTDTLLLDKLDPNLGAAGPHGPETVDVMFGRFVRNVPVSDDVDDSRYLERSYQFEVSYPDLGGIGVDEFEYAIGNVANEMVLNDPLAEKATMTFGFIGTISDDITPTRKTGAATATAPLRTVAFNTSAGLSITTDLVSSVSQICFKNLTTTILNNVSPEKCLGTLGAVFIAAGLFEANLEGQMLFTDKQIVNAIKNNTTVTLQSIMLNQDGAIVLDIPEMTAGGGGREFPVDQSVLVNITGASFTSNQFGYDIGISFLPAVPGVIA